MDPDPSSPAFYDIDPVTGFAVLLLLLLCSAVISGTETALFSLRPEDVDAIGAKSPEKGKKVVSLLQKPKKLLATIVVTNTFINIAIIVLFFRLNTFAAITPYFLRFTAQLATLAFMILLFGEVLPKLYAARNNIKFSGGAAYPLFALNKLLSPVSVPMREFTLFLHKKFGTQKSNLSVGQLYQALELTDYSDTTIEEQKILEGIVTFGNTEVRQVMSPRIDIFALEIGEGFPAVFSRIVEKGFSRIPVYKDNIDDIQGVLFIKDLIPYIDREDFEWQSLVREPFFVPENKKLDNLLKEFQSMKNHLAIVVDEYGGTSGIVSLEDILEEIVGDISDEFDDDDIIYSKIDEKNYLFDGKVSLRDFYRVTNADETVFEEHKGEAETLAGFILEISGNFPKKGQKIIFKDNTFTIESINKTRIQQIKVTLA